MTARCQWASCKAPAVVFEDGWHWCATHLSEHRQMKREDTAAQVRAARLDRRNSLTLRAALLTLHNDGLSDPEIADRLGIPIRTVATERHELGLRPHPRPRVPRGHGTHAGYNSHRDRREQPCSDCILGERVYQRERSRVRRAAAKARAA